MTEPIIAMPMTYASTQLLLATIIPRIKSSQRGRKLTMYSDKIEMRLEFPFPR